MTIQRELNHLEEFNGIFYAVAFVNRDRVLSVYEGQSMVKKLMKGDQFASIYEFKSYQIIRNIIIFFLDDKEAKICTKGRFVK